MKIQCKSALLRVHKEKQYSGISDYNIESFQILFWVARTLVNEPIFRFS